MAQTDPRYRDWMTECGRLIAAKIESGEFDRTVAVMQRVGNIDKSEAMALVIRDNIAVFDPLKTMGV